MTPMTTYSGDTSQVPFMRLPSLEQALTITSYLTRAAACHRLPGVLTSLANEDPLFPVPHHEVATHKSAVAVLWLLNCLSTEQRETVMLRVRFMIEVEAGEQA